MKEEIWQEAERGRKKPPALFRRATRPSTYFIQLTKKTP